MKWIVMVALLVACAAACGGDGQQAAPSPAQGAVSPGGGDTGSETETGPPERDEPVEDAAVPEAPFDELLGVQREFDYDEELAAQERIAACMTEQGFDYVPYVPERGQTYSSGPAPGFPEPGSDEWVARYGFGITTKLYPQEEVGPDLVGYESGDGTFFEEDVEDPNLAIAGELSESEREAYYDALHGEAEGPDAYSVWNPGGCEGEGHGNSQAEAFYDDFADEIEDLYERVDADPRLAEAQQAVTACVADQGFDYAGQETVYELLMPGINEVAAMVPSALDQLSDEEREALSDEESDELASQFVFSEAARAKLAELQEQEVTLALVVHECGGGQDAELDLRDEITAEYQREFIEQHGASLAEYRAGGA